MSKISTTVVAVLSIALIAAGLGCAMMAEKVTPAAIDRNAVQYAERAGTAEPNEYGGYPSLEKARRLGRDVDAGHKLTQLELKQQMATDSAEYGIARDTVETDINSAEEIADAAFGEGGLLTAGLSMMGAGSLAGYVGYRTRRKGDISQEDANIQKAEAEAAAKKKESQLGEVVRGIEAFKKVIPAELWSEFKGVIQMSPETKAAVTKAKA